MQEFLKNKKYTFTELLLAILTVFFFVISPLAYFANTHLAISVNKLALVVATALLLIVLIFLNRKKKSFALPKFLEIKIAISENYPLLIALAVYFLVHIINFRFYVFIPEWDSYGDLININRVLASGFSDITYRPLFTMSTALLSSLMGISPYHIFSIFFIILQSIVLVVAYKFLRVYEVKSKILQLFFLLGIISIPVLAMEIDMARPQNVFLIFFPIYIYFLHDFLSKRKMLSLFFASLIAILGRSYHEFFIFLLFFHLAVFLFLGYRKYILNKLTPRKVFALMIVLTGLIALMPKLFYKSSALAGLFYMARSVSQRVLDIEKWRPWFIDSYWSDNELLQMGWPGFSGAAKYYAYYASPFILLLFVLLVVIWLTRNDFAFFKNKLSLIVFSFFAIFFTFAEILPRLNYHYLPERYWIFIDITTIFMSIPALKYFEENPIKRRNILPAMFFCILVGVSGIFYVSHGKKALTSKNEYEAAQWIQKNTPNNSVFVSQSANYPMIKYFSNREVFYPTESFFLGAQIEKDAQPEKTVEIEKSKNEIIGQMRKDFDEYIFATIYFDEFEMRLRENKKKLIALYSTTDKQLPKITGPAYVLYSTDKFNTIYTQRAWWRISNFYGANLKKFDENFNLVYQNEAVKIWQMQ